MKKLFLFCKRPAMSLAGAAVVGLSACSTSTVSSSFDYENMDVKASPVLSEAEEREQKMERMFFSGKVDEEGNLVGRSQYDGVRFNREDSTFGGEYKKKEYGDHPYYEFRNNVGFDKSKFQVKSASETEKASSWEGLSSDESGDRFVARKANEASQGVPRKNYDVGRKSREEASSPATYEGEKYWYRILSSPNEDSPLDVQSVRELLQR